MISRPSFGPEVLAKFDLTMNEVCDELRAERPTLSESRLRAKLARPLITIASAGMSDDQTKQLLLRKIRNEWLGARHRSTRRRTSVRNSLDRIERAPSNA